jgi:hypothetical protein
MKKKQIIILVFLILGLISLIVFLIVHFTKSSGGIGNWSNEQINNIADLLQQQVPAKFTYLLPRDILICISKGFSSLYTYDKTVKCLKSDDSSCSDFKANASNALGNCLGTVGNWPPSIKNVMIQVVVKHGISTDKANCLVNKLEQNYDVMALLTDNINVDSIYKACGISPPSPPPVAGGGEGGDIKGICYFDVDGTLTTANGDKDEMMKACLDNNFDIGIITASPRTLDDSCDGDISKVNWMPNSLCKKFNETGGRLFNSTVSVAGNSKLPSNYPKGYGPGYIKGFDMSFCRDSFYPQIPDKCLLLFDDDPDYLKGVKQFNPNLNVQCANTSCGGSKLDINVVKDAIDRSVKNGCV